MVRGAWSAVVVACALGGVARAEDSAPEETVAAATLPAPDPVVPEAIAEPVARPAEPKPKKDEEEPAQPSEPQVRVSGRVLARGESDQRTAFEREVGIAQARLEIEASYGFADAVIEADLAGEELLKDAYLRLEAGEQLRFYGGQFKAPFLQRQLESTWDLPRVGRGLVEDYLVETHQLGGRRLGVMTEAKLPWLPGLKVSGGLFQGARDLTDQVLGEDAALRLQLKPWKPLKVGANAYVAEVFDRIRRYAVATDATLSAGKLELTGEAGFGQVVPGKFTSQSAIATYEVLATANGWSVRPTLSGEALQLRTRDGVGFGWGGAVGVNALLDDRFKFQLQLQRAQRADDDRPANDVAVQVGARF